MASKLSFQDRVLKAAEILSISPSDLMKQFEEYDFKNTPETIQLLEADTTSLEDLMDILKVCVPSKGMKFNKIRAKAAASILKGGNPFEKEEPITASVSPRIDSTIVELIKSGRPIEQWNDRELLEKYAKDRDYEVEQELHKRAKQQHFIVLLPGKDSQNKELIDIDTSLDLLKSARKRTNPSILAKLDGKIVPVYRITELNPDDRIMELCPICLESLYKGYCEKCNINVSMIGDEQRAYMALIAKTEKNLGVSDKKAIVASASKGLEDLKNTWPSLAASFDQMKLIGNLPRLRFIANRPSQADPFFQDGNRAFGNKAY